jgi:hypothetical protein
VHCRLLDRGLPPTDVSHRLPLSSGNRAVALCMAAGVPKLCLSVLGNGILGQLGLIAHLRSILVCHPRSYDKVTQSFKEKEDTTFVRSLSWPPVSCSL